MMRFYKAIGIAKHILTFMETIDEKYRIRYLKETKELLHYRVKIILWVGIILFPVFALLDLVAVREYFTLFFTLRILCALFFLGLLFLLSGSFGRKHPFVIGMIACILGGITISLMVLKMGGYTSHYYVGIVMVLVAYSTLLPLNVLQSALSSCLLYLIYAVPVIMVSEPISEHVRIFFYNSFFFVFFIVLLIIQCNEETQARITQFNLRIELDSLLERLSYYSQNLEIEVEKRAKALEESELRYRELYDNIIDMVTLVDRNGKVLMANPRFFNTIAISNNDKIDFLFKQYVHPEDVSRVEKQLFSRLLKEDNVKDFQFRMVNNNHGPILDVECNAKCIKKEGKLIGFQMVIRDITRRKKMERDLLESYKKVQYARIATILGLAKLTEYRDKDTGNHLERIREYSRTIAEELAKKPKYKNYITQQFIDDIYLSSILHDIGKVGIPDAILLKPGKLTSEEFEVLKLHSVFGGNALKEIESRLEGKSFLTLGKQITYFHHEKWDGTGYPKGLKGEEIPLSTQIVSLADVYDALTSKRCYKNAYSHEHAKEIIISNKGSHFASEIVDAFLRREDEFTQIREKMHD